METMETPTYHIPEDTSDCFYIEKESTLDAIIAKCKEKWGESISFNNIKIESKYIHVYCIFYDLHDPSDYSNYLMITRLT